PRRDVAGVARGTPCADALRSAIAVGHRRVPVYDTTIDHIDGFVRMRDLARAASGPSPGTVDERMQAALVVPRSMMLIQLLRRMQASDHHLAVVVDEAGRTEGIATIEDVVRQLVGAIDDQSSPTHPGGR
ncbi:MAG: CBS domain-containing protein, partial [Actinomycetota bacterium]